MIGSMNAEISGGFVNNSKTNEDLFSLFGNLKEEAKSAYDPQGKSGFNEVITRFNTDWVWGEPARMTAQAFSKNGSPTFIYLFSYVPAAQKERMKYGAGHGSEIAYAFNNLNARWGVTETTTEDQKLAQTMNTYWANFAKTGNPNGKSLPIWPLYSPATNELMEFESNGIPVGKKDSTKARLDVISKTDKLRDKLKTRGI
jgi:para-nitrobenzyl esterase